MDAFKTHEISRMDKGGNKAWKAFFEQHQLTKLSGVGWDQSTVADRYGGEVGDEWKDRLTARVEGRDYVPGEKKEKKSATDSAAASRSATPSRNLAGPGSSAPRDRSPSAASLSGGVGSRKEKNEAYFSKMGAENANRPEDLPPSQGGKYAGFGSAPAPGPEPRTANGALPGLDDLQKDPVAAVSKSFGWFAAAVGKSAKTVNDGFIQPTAQKVFFPRLVPFQVTFLTLGVARRGGSRHDRAHPRGRPRPEPPGRHQGRGRDVQPLRRGRGRGWQRRQARGPA